MRRDLMLAPIVASVLLFGASVAGAAPAARTEATATVTAVTVVPGAGRADVVLSFDGTVSVSDFLLESPHRICVQPKAQLSISPRLEPSCLNLVLKPTPPLKVVCWH